MLPKKGPNPYGQPPQPHGQIPGNGGYPASAAAAGGARFSSNPALGTAAGQYGGAYASVYGAQQVGGFAGKGPGSSGLPSLQSHQTALSESSKFSSGVVGSSLGRSNDDYVGLHGYGQKLDQYSANYAIDRRMYGEQPANIGRRDALTDLDRRYLDHISGNQKVSSMRHQQLLKTQLQPGSDIRQADYFAGRTGPIHQGSQELSAYGRVEADRHNLSVLGSTPRGGQHPSSLLGGAHRTNIDGPVYGLESSSSGYGEGLPSGRDYPTGKDLLYASSESDYRDSILSRVHPGISMVDERTEWIRRELDLRDDEHRRDLLWEREKEREWERRQELRDHERDREHDRERERDRLRDRDHERERLRERHEKERERDRKHGADPRRERTPLRTSGERQRSSSVKSEKPLRLLSPRRDAVHRHRSPIKQIKREYICKVFPLRLVDAEKDYLSLIKRYPRLVIPTDFCKVILNWPKENFNLSLRTPVSLEHDIHEVDVKVDERAVSSTLKSYCTNKTDTVWNVKVLLMSGMSNSAFTDICSLRSAEERIVHLNNILKFAVFKKDRALNAIGGPWDTALDGGDPLVDNSCLIRTAVRYVQELVQVDLSTCTQWNHFLEVHYNRVSKDGLFKHKEITVLFVPNLSECLPLVDLWKNNWIAYRKAKVERELSTKKKEKSAGDAKKQEQGTDDHAREGGIGQDVTKTEKVDTDMDQQGKDGIASVAVSDGKELGKVEVPVEKGGDVRGNTSGDTSVAHATDDKTPTGKKVIKKVVKKVVCEKPAAEASAADKSSQTGMTVGSETVRKTLEEQNQQTTEDVGKEKDEAGIDKQPEARKSGKKKVIRRIVKRKVSASGSKLSAETSKQEVVIKLEKNDGNLTDAGNSRPKMAEGSKTAEVISNQKKEEDAEKKRHTSPEGQKIEVDKLSEDSVKQKDDKKERGNGKKDKTMNDKEKKKRDPKKDMMQRSHHDTKEKKKADEPPKRPGFILRTKRGKESNIRSISLSLNGLLDYTINDIEGSVFELSLFAESFSEMLQYRMGCIILSFLEKLHRYYVVKKNQRKHPREEDLKKEDEKSSGKRPKTKNETCTESAPSSSNPVKTDEAIKEGEKEISIDQSATAACDKPEVEGKKDGEEPESEEDPEEVEIYEEGDEDMDDSITEEQSEGNLNNTEAKPEEVIAEDNGNKKTEKELKLENIASVHEKTFSGEDKQSIAEKGGLVGVGEKAVNKEGKTAVLQKVDSANDEVVDKNLLQAFRYFDQNRVGYIKVEDLRCILHNLGKFLSHRHVKDLVQAALDESNSARDNRVIYTTLVKMVDL